MNNYENENRNAQNQINAERQRTERAKAVRTLTVFVCILLVVSVFLSFLSASAYNDSTITSSQTGSVSVSQSAPTTSTAVQTTPVVSTPVQTQPSTPTPDIPSYRSEITVWIDAGHGWYDNGSYYEFLGEFYEKQINLSISLKLRDYLTALGFKVEMIRTDDVNVPEDGLIDGIYKDARRASLVNKHKGNLFVSIHCNKFAEDESIYGTRIYYRNKNNPTLTPNFCKAVADMISTMDDSSVRTYDHYDYNVLYTKCPSLLIECGFVTNQNDAAKLTSPEWQDEFAEMIAKGIAEFADANHQALKDLY